MSHTYTPSPVLLTTITLPDDGDLETAASVNNPMQTLADGIDQAQLPATSSTSNYQLASRTLDRVERSFFLPQDPAHWTFATNGGLVTADTSGNSAHIALSFPHGSSINAISCYLDPAGGHANLPQNMPTITLRKKAFSNGAVTDIATATDTSVNTTVYQARHSIDIVSLAEVVNLASFQYFLVVVPESGTDSIAGCLFDNVVKQFVVTSLDSGAS